jgi:hypothetical protein
LTLNKTEKTIAIVLLMTFSATYFIKSTPGLGKPWNQHTTTPTSTFNYEIRWLRWLCWIPGIHCIAVMPNNSNNTMNTTHSYSTAKSNFTIITPSRSDNNNSIDTTNYLPISSSSIRQ